MNNDGPCEITNLDLSIPRLYGGCWSCSDLRSEEHRDLNLIVKTNCITCYPIMDLGYLIRGQSGQTDQLIEKAKKILEELNS